MDKDTEEIIEQGPERGRNKNKTINYFFGNKLVVI